MLVCHRPAIIESDPLRLDAEFRAARWMHHRLLDFEDQHQAELDRAAEVAAPGILRVARILARLAGRQRRAERTTAGTWAPNPRPELAATLRQRLTELKRQRNASPEWAAALKWADEPVGPPKAVRRRRAKDPSKVKRRKNETDEAFEARFALLTTDETDEHFAAKLANPPRDTRRDVYQKALYAELRTHWSTWNGLLKSVEQARSAVLACRRSGMSAAWRRPRWDEPATIYAEKGGFRIVERGQLWWTIEMRIGTNRECVRFRAKCGNWHALPEDAKFVYAQLTRRRDNRRWRYSVSLTVDMAKPQDGFATQGLVALDWGHREHGHDRAEEGLRVFTWVGDDGASGEVIIPASCRALLDEVDALKARMDTIFNARKAELGLPDKNRYAYRARLERCGVLTQEQSAWLQWETRYERRAAKPRRRVQTIRNEVYLQAIRQLRQRYATFVVEDESIKAIKRRQTDEQMARRKRSNRDMAARYAFVSLCERFGGMLVKVSAHNTTRECPYCGTLAENGPALLIACPGCGLVRDKDYGAARVILARGQEALAKQAAKP